MQIICTSFQTDNHASPSSLTCLTCRTLFLTPNQQCQNTEGIMHDRKWRKSEHGVGLIWRLIHPSNSYLTDRSTIAEHTFVLSEYILLTNHRRVSFQGTQQTTKVSQPRSTSRHIKTRSHAATIDPRETSLYSEGRTEAFLWHRRYAR